jgi:D-3-phosphoglycerate dehydrogenase
MHPFKVVLLKHGYSSVQPERDIVTKAGGQFIDADGLSEEESLEHCKDADGILVRWLKITPELIQRFGRCKIILRYGVGYDNVDVNASTAAGIIVGHVPTYCLDEVSNHAIALLLDCVRKVTLAHNRMKQGGWDINPSARMYRTAGRTLGLVGLGNIGQAVARKMSGWGMQLVASDPFVDPSRAESLGVKLVSLETLCQQSDFISLHTPLLPETRHLISHAQFRLMRPGVILVNTARGPVLNTAALLAALNDGTVAWAGLDVFEQEPPAVDSPLRNHPRLLMTDHVAWYSEESELELKTTAAEEVVRVCTGGLPRSLANPEVLQRLGRFKDWTMNDTVRWQLKRLEALR